MFTDCNEHNDKPLVIASFTGLRA